MPLPPASCCPSSALSWTFIYLAISQRPRLGLWVSSLVPEVREQGPRPDDSRVRPGET